MLGLSVSRDDRRSVDGVVKRRSEVVDGVASDVLDNGWDRLKFDLVKKEVGILRIGLSDLGVSCFMLEDLNRLIEVRYVFLTPRHLAP